MHHQPHPTHLSLVEATSRWRQELINRTSTKRNHHPPQPLSPTPALTKNQTCSMQASRHFHDISASLPRYIHPTQARGLERSRPSAKLPPASSGTTFSRTNSLPEATCICICIAKPPSPDLATTPRAPVTMKWRGRRRMHLSDRLYAVEYARTATATTTTKTSPGPKDGRRGSITALANPIGTSHTAPPRLRLRLRLGRRGRVG